MKSEGPDGPDFDGWQASTLFVANKLIGHARLPCMHLGPTQLLGDVEVAETQLARHLVGHDAAEAQAQQVIGAVRLLSPDQIHVAPRDLLDELLAAVVGRVGFSGENKLDRSLVVRDQFDQTVQETAKIYLL